MKLHFLPLAVVLAVAFPSPLGAQVAAGNALPLSGGRLTGPLTGSEINHLIYFDQPPYNGNFQAAYNALAASGGTLALSADLTLTHGQKFAAVNPAKKPVWIDLQGHTLTLNCGAGATIPVSISGYVVPGGACLDLEGDSEYQWLHIRNGTITTTATNRMAGVFCRDCFEMGLSNVLVTDFKNPGQVAVWTSFTENWLWSNVDFTENATSFIIDFDGDDGTCVNCNFRYNTGPYVIDSAAGVVFLGGKTEDTSASCAAEVNDTAATDRGGSGTQNPQWIKHHFENNGTGRGGAHICFNIDHDRLIYGAWVQGTNLNGGSSHGVGSVPFRASGGGGVLLNLQNDLFTGFTVGGNLFPGGIAAYTTVHNVIINGSRGGYLAYTFGTGTNAYNSSAGGSWIGWSSSPGGSAHAYGNYVDASNGHWNWCDLTVNPGCTAPLLDYDGSAWHAKAPWSVDQGIRIGSGNTASAISGEARGSGILRFTSLRYPGCQEQALTIRGASPGDVCWASTGASDIGANFSYAGCRVSAANTAQIKVCNQSGSEGAPAAVTWTGWARH